MLLAELVATIRTRLGVRRAELVTACSTSYGVFGADHVLADVTGGCVVSTVPVVAMGALDRVVGTDVLGTGRTGLPVGVASRRVVDRAHTSVV